MATAHLGMRTTAILAAQVSAERSTNTVFVCIWSIDNDTLHVDWSDVNECATNNGGCDSKRTCTNTVGGRTCGDCSSGYENDGDTDCAGQSEWVDELAGIDERGNFCSCA